MQQLKVGYCSWNPKLKWLSNFPLSFQLARPYKNESTTTPPHFAIPCFTAVSNNAVKEFCLNVGRFTLLCISSTGDTVNGSVVVSCCPSRWSNYMHRTSGKEDTSHFPQFSSPQLSKSPSNEEMQIDCMEGTLTLHL